MWIWILLGFIIVGAIIGGLTSDDDKGQGCLFGALGGLIEGGGCLIRLLLLLGLISLACWIFS